MSPGIKFVVMQSSKIQANVVQFVVLQTRQGASCHTLIRRTVNSSPFASDVYFCILGILYPWDPQYPWYPCILGILRILVSSRFLLSLYSRDPGILEIVVILDILEILCIFGILEILGILASSGSFVSSVSSGSLVSSESLVSLGSLYLLNVPV